MTNTVRLGNAEITRVEELLGPGFEPGFLFPDWTDDALRRHGEWMIPNFFDPVSKRFIASIHSWVIRTKHHTIIVDSCAGNDKSRPAFERFNMLKTPYLERLAAAGVDPSKVDFVLCTHLHVDHVGWNTRLIDGKWRPTFPNARYVFSQIEYDYWRPGGAGSDRAENRNVFEDSVAPVMEGGLGKVVDGLHELVEGVRLEPAPGHTPGHVIVSLSHEKEEAIFSGDVMHQPIQIYEPDWNSRFCTDAAAARTTRRRLLERCACNGSRILPGHFGAPHSGFIREKAGSFSFACEAV